MFNHYLNEKGIEKIIYEFVYGINYQDLKKIIFNRIQDIQPQNLENLTKYFYNCLEQGTYDIYLNKINIKILLRTISEILDNRNENFRFYMHMRYEHYNPSLYEIVINIIDDVEKINKSKYHCVFYGYR